MIISDVTKSYGYHHVLNGVSLIVNHGERIGLVGANGVGKSTLLKIIVGDVESDGGSIHIPADHQVGYLPQQIVYDGTIQQMMDEAQAHLHQLEAHLRTLEDQMAEGGEHLDDVLLAYGDALEAFERYGGYEMENRVDVVLHGLNIEHLARDRMVETLSGGEKSRMMLAALLLRAPDILLLDEPTNHLDFATIAWLESYLSAYRGGVLMVSHDRHFLNRTVNAIVEIDEHTRKAKRYSGNYDAYLLAKAQERRKWEYDFHQQQEEIKALRHEIKVGARQNLNDRKHIRTDGDKFLRNFKKAGHEHTVSRKVNAAEEKLKRIEADPIPRPPDDLRFESDFSPEVFRGRSPLRIEHLCKAYDGRVILDDLSTILTAQSRIVLVGENGAGKSTLLKILMGIESPDAGTFQFSSSVQVGYLSQERGALDPDMTLFEAYQNGLEQSEQQLKAILLGSGIFRYDDLDKRVRELSSGQERKVQIARLMASRANFLILDEPTNDVSFDVLEGLESALQSFPGPIIAASHDRRFIENFGGEIWQLAEGEITIDLAYRLPS